eukprot:scaffold459527_cov29-Prasinocladus_malaysianus.AAC.1
MAFLTDDNFSATFEVSQPFQPNALQNLAPDIMLQAYSGLPVSDLMIYKPTTIWTRESTAL